MSPDTLVPSCENSVVAWRTFVEISRYIPKRHVWIWMMHHYAGFSIEEIAKAMKVTRERVRQIELKSAKDMRAAYLVRHRHPNPRVRK